MSAEGAGPAPRRAVGCLAACMFAGLVLAVLPHLATLWRDGTVDYLADGDDVIYLTVARPAYHGEWSLRDPFRRPSEHSPSLYAWLQFIPLAKLASALGVPLVDAGLLWRALGGPLLAASIFALFLEIFRRSRRRLLWTTASTILCLSDAGFVQGRFLLQNVLHWHGLLRGHMPGIIGNAALPHFRIVTPLLNLPAVFWLARLFIRDPADGAARCAAGVAALALCVYLYFFYWTAAALAIGLYGAYEFVVARRSPPETPRRWARFRLAAVVLLGGLAAGAPQILSNARTFGKPEYRQALDRLSRGVSVPKGDPARTMYLWNTWRYAALTIGAVGIFALGFRRLTFVWLLALAAFALRNSALVTGLEFENFHWSYVGAPCSEILVLSVFAFVVDAAGEGRAGRIPAAGFCALSGLLLASALFWRPYEALRAYEPAMYSEILRELRPLEPELSRLRPEEMLAGPFEANVASLFGRPTQLYQFNQLAHSSLVPDRVVHERYALNAWVQGLSLAQYQAQLSHVGRFQAAMITRPEWEPAHVRSLRVELFNAIDRDGGGELLSKYHPEYLLLPVGGRPRPVDAWRLVRTAGKWSLWTRGSAAGRGERAGVHAFDDVQRRLGAAMRLDQGPGRRAPALL